jgi:hypothetical protein
MTIGAELWRQFIFPWAPPTVIEIKPLRGWVKVNHSFCGVLTRIAI